MSWSNYAVLSVNITIMKNFILYICILSGVFSLFVSCENDEANKSSLHIETVKTGEHPDPCCEVICTRGSCRTFKSPCGCSCVAGIPVCKVLGGSGSLKNGQDSITVEIEVTPEQLSLYDKDIEYLSSVPNSENAVVALKNIKRLFEINNLKISSQDAVNQYNENANIYADFINNASKKVIDKLSILE